MLCMYLSVVLLLCFLCCVSSSMEERLCRILEVKLKINQSTIISISDFTLNIGAKHNIYHEIGYIFNS